MHVYSEICIGLANNFKLSVKPTAFCMRMIAVFKPNGLRIVHFFSLCETSCTHILHIHICLREVTY